MFKSFFILLTTIPLLLNAQISILSPFGGEYLQNNSNYQITWSTSIGGQLEISFSSNGGTGWNVIESGIDANLGTVDWTTPDITSNSCKIKITSLNDINNIVTSFNFTIGNDLPLQRILVDEEYDDWDIFPNLAQLATDGGDVNDLKLINDEHILYIYFETDDILSLQNNNSLTLYMDTDDNATTGKLVNGIGAEIEFNFGARSGTVYLSSNQYTVGVGDFFLIISPTIWSDKFELTFNLDSSVGGTDLFSSPRIRLLIKDGSDGTSLPAESGGAGYSLGDYDFAPLPSYSMNKQSEEFIRVLSHNVLFSNFMKTEATDVYKRLYEAIQPNIIGFSELYEDYSIDDIKLRMEEILPSNGDRSWNVQRTNDNVLATRYNIKYSTSAGPFGNGAFLIDLRPDYNSDLLMIVAHPPCCDNDAARQNETDAIAAFIRDAKAPGGELTISENTPVIIVGDMNYVGDPAQPLTLINGDIIQEGTYGNDYTPDWDGTSFEDAKPLTTNLPHTFTQGGAGDPGRYSKGRLDYIIYSGSVLDLKNSFVAYTPSMPQDTLSLYGLLEDDTNNASDHLPLVADFMLTQEQERSVLYSIRQNDENGIPLTLGQRITVNGIVTSANDLGSNGPAFIQDNQVGSAVYGSAFVSQLTKGDSITITGKIAFYNGLSQLSYVEGESAVTIHKNSSYAEPEIVTIQEIINQDWDGFELIEGKLIRINNITFVESGTFSGNTNYQITDGINNFNVRIDGDTDIAGTPIPVTEFSIVGCLGQFDSSEPYSSGYQLFPRNRVDIGETSVIALFSADITSGTSPLIVNFSSLSLNNPTSWVWDFGDGSASNSQDPQHTYSDVGDYTVSLTVSDGSSTDTETKTDFISVFGEEILGGPYTSDANTILLMHFDGNLNEVASSYTINDHGIAKSYFSNPVSGLNNTIHFDNSLSSNQSFISVPYTSELSMTGNWTIEFWFYIKEWDQNHNKWPVPIVLPSAGWDANYYLEIPAELSRLKYGFNSNDGGAQVLSSQGSISTGIWYHVALINDYDNNKIKLELHDKDFNKLEEQTALYTAGTTISTGTQDLKIGTGIAGDNYFNGYIDELRISNLVRDFTAPVPELPPLQIQTNNIEFYSSSSDANTWSTLSQAMQSEFLELSSYWDRPGNPQLVPLGTKIKIYHLNRSDFEQYAGTVMPAWKCGWFIHDVYTVLVTTPDGTEQENYYGTFESLAKGSLAQLMVNLHLINEGNNSASFHLLEGFGLYRGGYRPNRDMILQAINDLGRYPVTSDINDNKNYTTDYMKDLIVSRIESQLFTGIAYQGINEWLSERVWSAYFKYYHENSDAARMKLSKTSNNFDIYCTQQDEQFLDTIVARLEEKLAHYRNCYEMEINNRFNIVIFPNEAAGMACMGYDDHYNGGSGCGGDKLDILSPINFGGGITEALYSLIPHEFFHVFHNHMVKAGTLYGFHPEGMAEFMTYGTTTPEYLQNRKWYIENAMKTFNQNHGRDPNLADFMADADGTLSVYTFGQAFWYYMHQNHADYTKIKQFFNDGQDWNVFEATYEEIEQGYLNYLSSIITLDINDEMIIPDELVLRQNYPNPFNPTTMVEYGIPEQSKIKIEIFNMLGQSVDLLVNSEKSAGYHETTWNAENLPSGIYLVRIRAEGLDSKKIFTQVKKAILLK